MDLRAHRVDALVLRAIAYGESDLVVHLLVRGRGRIPAFARGARSSRKRFGGALEPFHRVEALLAEREGQELWALREARLVDGHAGLRECGEMATSLALSHASRVALRQLRAGGLGAADAPTSADGSGRPADARGFEDACVQAQRPLRLFLQHHIGRSLRSADFLAQVGAPQ